MSFGNAENNDGNEMSDINMTPLIDVMLVLLIIFIITMPVITHSVQIDLPSASSQKAVEKPQSITLAIDRQGKVFWNNRDLSDIEFKSELQAASQQKPQPEIHIRGDKEAKYGLIAGVMATVQQAGLTRLGFVTEPEYR